MDLTKLRLSPTEMDLVTDREWILTKNGIISKLHSLMAHVSSEQQDHLDKLHHHLPKEILTLPPKISKGENYRGLPYMILDYPRIFGKEKIFAIRSMFWWGNFFSITLQLSGEYKQMFTEKIINGYNSWKENGYYYCISTDPWMHEFSLENYKTTDPGFEDHLRKHPFIKLAKKFPINEWEKVAEKLVVEFKKIISILNGQNIE